MFIELAQKVIGGAIVIGGLGGGYFALTGGTNATLSGMHLSDRRYLNKNWKVIADEYRLEKNNDLIDGIKKTSVTLENDIKEWCENKASDYFLGEKDPTYRSYSLWCVGYSDIKNALIGKGFKLVNKRWDKKLEKYKDHFEQFIVDQYGKVVPKEKLNIYDLMQWCHLNGFERYRYQGDELIDKVRQFCFWNDDEEIPEDDEDLKMFFY